MARTPLGGGFPTCTLSVCAAGSQFPHVGRFHSALLSSRTVAFHESGWRRQLFTWPLPRRRLAQTPARRHPHVSELSALLRYPLAFHRLLPALCPAAVPRRSHCPPRVPLHAPRRCRACPALLAQVSGSHAAFIAPTDSCARPSSCRRLRLSLFLRVLAGCGESLLHDGPSRHYLCDPCLGAWVPTPSRSSGALVRFFPESFGLTLGSSDSARDTLPQRSSMRGEYFGAATSP
jgi:hypothetical protein